jgi:glycogen(starch) synthase
LVEQKGFDLAIAAFGAIASRHPTARLVVVGDGPLARELAAQAAAVPGADRIEFLGEVDRLHVADLMGESVAVLMPSRWEGHPLVALEAARAGRPVIASRCPGGLVDVVVDGGTGIVVDADDVPGLAAALHELLANRPLARALGDEARRRAERGPSVSDCAARYEDIFGSLGATRDRW